MVCSVAAGTQAEYYISEQASYYTGGREPPGHWYIRGSGLDLTDGGKVDDGVFTAIHAGQNPDTGKALGQARSSRNTAGFDLTFSAPKSVSTVWALASAETRSSLEIIHDASVRAALDLLNDHAAFTRRGHGGRQIEKIGLTAAIFQHGEARPIERDDGRIEADPQLHAHAVVMNLAEREDGSWGALDGRHLYQWKVAAGALYRAELARGIQELGFSVTRTRADGLFEIDGIPSELCTAFSARREEIKAILDANDTNSAAFASAVARSTRVTKRADPDLDRHGRWRERAAECRISEVEIEQLRTSGQQVDKTPAPDVLARLTEHDSTFDLRNLHAAIAGAWTATGVGAAEVRVEVARLIESGEVVFLGHDEISQPVYSTPEIVRIESELQRLARSAKSRQFRTINAASVRDVAARHSLSDEQRAACEAACGNSAVAVIEGAAGSGKSTTLRAVAEQYHASGSRVIGMADSWRAARELGTECDIESRATAAWLAAAESKPFLDGNTVVIVDEAGLLSSRQMHRILTLAEEAGAKVILSGDQKQLQAIGPGPGLRIVAEAIGTTRVDTIRRQRDPWLRDTVTALTGGQTEAGLTALRDHDCLHWRDRPADAVKAALECWKDHLSQNPTASVMLIARTNAQVRALNAEMRKHLRENDVIGGREVTISTENASGQKEKLTLARGDQIRFLVRNDRLAVINGSIGRIRHVTQDADGHARIIANVDGETVRFSTRDLAGKTGGAKLAHAYASTLYSSQGATVDAAFLVVDPAWTRNDIYVGISRARDAAQVFLDRRSVDVQIKADAPLSDRRQMSINDEQRFGRIVTALSREATKVSTLDWRPGVDAQQTTAESSPARLSRNRDLTPER